MSRTNSLQPMLILRLNCKLRASKLDETIAYDRVLRFALEYFIDRLLESCSHRVQP